MPLLELIGYRHFQMILLIDHYILKSLQVAVLLQLCQLLVHLLEHFHQYLGPDLDLAHRIILFADIVAFMVAKKCARMTYHVLACDTYQLARLVVVVAGEDYLLFGRSP